MKDESARLGLPAFKVLGASWVSSARGALTGGRVRELGDDRGTRGEAGTLRPLDLVAATDGNHGRALARGRAPRARG